MSVAAITNAMTVDVEDYFQVYAFEHVLKGRDWSAFECRIPRNVERILELFAKHNVKATFFTLGWVAQRFPLLVRAMVDAGHEVASHGMRHVRVTDQTPEQFREDASAAKQLLEEVTGKRVLGYRAASYSICERNLWALDVLAECGYEYSSSVYPIRHDIYGMPHAPRFSFRAASGRLLEIPVTTVSLFGRKWPSGGGGYFRLLPYVLSRWAIRHVNGTDNEPALFYFHPWEIDPAQPRIENAGWRSTFRHYLNLKRMETRLERLLSDFRWDRMDRVFLSRSVTHSLEPTTAVAVGEPC